MQNTETEMERNCIMFRKLVTAALVSVALSTSALAQTKHDPAERFFEHKAGGWTTVGRYAYEKDNPNCGTTKWWEDGSAFTIVHDLNDKELYLVVTNTDWQFDNEPGVEGIARLNAYRGNKIMQGAKLTIRVVNKNTIVMRHMPTDFIVPFSDADYFDLIMPNNVPNWRGIQMSGSGSAFAKVIDCIKASNKVDLYQNVKARHPRTLKQEL